VRDAWVAEMGERVFVLSRDGGQKVWWVCSSPCRDAATRCCCCGEELPQEARVSTLCRRGAPWLICCFISPANACSLPECCVQLHSTHCGARMQPDKAWNRHRLLARPISRRRPLRLPARPPKDPFGLRSSRRRAKWQRRRRAVTWATSTVVNTLFIVLAPANRAFYCAPAQPRGRFFLCRTNHASLCRCCSCRHKNGQVNHTAGWLAGLLGSGGSMPVRGSSNPSDTARVSQTRVGASCATALWASSSAVCSTQRELAWLGRCLSLEVAAPSPSVRCRS
jgi:hypothetical protein